MHCLHSRSVAVTAVWFINGPAPTRVWALSDIVYMAAGINPSMVCIIALVSVMYDIVYDVSLGFLYWTT